MEFEIDGFAVTGLGVYLVKAIIGEMIGTRKSGGAGFLDSSFPHSQTALTHLLNLIRSRVGLHWLAH